MNTKKSSILLLVSCSLLLLSCSKKFDTIDGFVEQQRTRKAGYLPVELGRQPSIVIMGDGYREVDFNSFRSAAKALENHLFDPDEGVSPFNKEPFCHYFNIFTIFLNSEEQGIGFEKAKNTALRCYFYNQTDIIFDDVNSFGGRKAPNPFDVAKQYVPEIDLNNTVIVILVNDSRTGFTTGSKDEAPYGQWISIITVPSEPNEFKRLVLREVGGKAFARLAQEDDSFYDRTLFQNWYNQYGFFANIDFTEDRTLVKWSHFLNYPSMYPQLGIYPAGSGAYRPDNNNVMLSNRALQYDAPSKEAIIKRIYQIHGEGWDYTNDTFWYYFISNPI